jgi:tetratricopeptide (TPR) repeat protein
VALRPNDELQTKLDQATSENKSAQSRLEDKQSHLLGVGDMLMAQGDLPEALKWYRLAVADRLLKSAPENAGWQRDLSVSYDKIGDVLEAGGNLFEALKTYQERHAIRDRLAKADPNNADRQRDLAMSQDRVATPKAVINGGM